MDLTLKEFKRTFFDREIVKSAMSKADLKALSRIGAFIRKRARSSIRKRKRVSKPGTPPTSRTGLLKQFIFFGYDASAGTVVVGPSKLASKRGQVPRLLEFGGQVTATHAFTLKSETKNGKPAFVPAGAVMNYQPRPFMGPALDKEIAAGTIPKQWLNSIQR